MLAELQRDFRAWLTTASDQAADKLGGGRAAPGLAVYQNNYRSQLVRVLEDSFPQLRAWIGEDAFLAAAVEHIDSHPPHAWTLDAYPARFGATLERLFPDNPDLHELAWLENALADAFVAADAEPPSPETLAALDWERARLRLTPSLLTRAAATNAAEVWSALAEAREPPEGEMLAEPGGLIVWRLGFTSRFRQADALEWTALVQVGEDGGFAALCERLALQLGEEQGVTKAGELLAAWLGEGLIAKVDEIGHGDAVPFE
jgi:hypothetical protein